MSKTLDFCDFAEHVLDIEIHKSQREFMEQIEANPDMKINLFPRTCINNDMFDTLSQAVRKMMREKEDAQRKNSVE